ncbi:hypothetical protein KP509_11G079300 [Ceratopteris richardii]|uniref:RNA polymerase II subunit B1 CTD phosphatase RPAP2 homolog n=1 Tax=Ceratopteris richardii TaxID=49495 RepID=A0A8T2TU79_CERRI|nr:hypothetical protein KP509_11G079300 [Ceratopteris richardii]KAH7425959.1 hypothetical protein KP509_11G079300 [Ceratopteris richardii]KAH7425960.1 hypothetical protein KP509_11G079300 [Ceratopteris richardii]
MALKTSIEAVKSSVFSVQVDLLEGISDETKLKAAGKVLTQNEYADVVTERTIIDMCGYPLCSNPLPSDFPHKGRYHISLREHKVYDMRETRLFCSSGCLVSSKSFAASLAVDREFSPKILELVSAFHDLGLPNEGHEQVTYSDSGKLLRREKHKDAYDQKQELNVNDSEGVSSPQSNTVLLIHEQDDLKPTDFSASSHPQAIEGYIPQKELRPSQGKKVPQEVENGFNELDSGFESKDGGGKSTKSKKKAVSSSSRRNEARRDSLDVQTEFVSCIVTDQGESSMDDCKNGAQRSRVASAKGAYEGSCKVTNNRTKKSGVQKQNRVTWADHNNLSLVEDLRLTKSNSDNAVLKDCYDLAVHSKEGDLSVEHSIAASGEAVAAVEDRKESLEGQETFCTGEKHIKGLENKEENLEHMKALAAALVEAAEAVAIDGIDPSEAVAAAGISIVPRSEGSGNYISEYLVEHKECLGKENEDAAEYADSKDCWYSAPPKEFKPELSTFGTLWVALDGWISSATIAHIYGRHPDEYENFNNVNGKEYLRQVVIPEGVSAEIEKTLAGCISRALPGLAKILRFPLPISTLEVSLGRLLRTMTFTKAIPGFSSKQWQMVLLLLLDALSVYHLPTIRTQILNGRHAIQKVLASAQVTEAEYEVFRDLLLPMGILPDFAVHCGG